MPMPGWIRYTGCIVMAPVCVPSSIEEIQRDAFEPQQLGVFLVVGADHHQRDCSVVAPPSSSRCAQLRHVDAVIARRVVAARAQVVLARARPAADRNGPGPP